jgi:N-acetylglucosaminyldiphosphoundecaprenol N-acetyl-beta-D-mannosaminyltransferase
MPDHAVPPRSHRVGDVAFTVMPLSRAIDLVMTASHSVGGGDLGHPGLSVHFCNAYNVALAHTDPAYARLLSEADVVFSDGVPITWVGRRAYPAAGAEWERVYGPDVMRGVLDRSAGEGPTHYLLGSTPETLATLRSRLAADHPHAVIAGAESPPFRAATPAELVERDERIRASGASIVWVGLGTPKQDTEVKRLASSLPVLAMAVGAAFDFLAGTKPQAPEWMQRSGLEWAFRLASEPGRLGKRYLWGNSVFALEAARTMRATRGERR